MSSEAHPQPRRVERLEAPGPFTAPGIPRDEVITRSANIYQLRKIGT